MGSISMNFFWKVISNVFLELVFDIFRGIGMAYFGLTSQLGYLERGLLILCFYSTLGVYFYFGKLDIWSLVDWNSVFETIKRLLKDFFLNNHTKNFFFITAKINICNLVRKKKKFISKKDRKEEKKNNIFLINVWNKCQSGRFLLVLNK